MSRKRPPTPNRTPSHVQEQSWIEDQLVAPLTQLLEACSRLAKTPLTGEQKLFLEQIRRSSRSLADNLSDLFPNKESSEVPDAFELRSVIESSLEKCSDAAWQQQVELAYSLQGDTFRALPGNPEPLNSLIQALTRLVLKLCSQGEMVLWVSREQSDDDEVNIQFSFRIMARSVDQLLIENAVIPLLNSSKSLPRRYDDIALELFPLVRRISKLRGTIELVSVQADGFTLLARLPWQAFDLGAPEPPDRHFDPGRTRVLLIGRDTMINALLRMNLGEWGLRVDMATDLPRSIQLLKQASLRRLPYAALLLDAELQPSPYQALIAAFQGQEQALSAPRLLFKHDRTPYPKVLEQLETDHHNIVTVISRPISWQNLKEVLQSACSSFLDRQSLRAEGTRSSFDSKWTSRSGAPERGAPTPPMGQASTGSELLPEESGPAHVLVVDDNEINRRVVTRMLEKLGYRATCAPDAASALKLLREATFDLAMIDYFMPDMDGPELAETIRHKLPIPASRLPLIAMTASPFEKEKKRCNDAGFSKVITKPVRLEALRQLLEDHLESAELPPAPSTPRAQEQPPPQAEPPELMRSSVLFRTNRDGATSLDSELLPLFLDQLSNHHRALLEGYGSKDVTAMIRAAHALKSVCVYLGAHRLALYCDTLQGMSGQLELGEAASVLTHLSQELEQVRTELHAVHYPTSDDEPLVSPFGQSREPNP